MSKRRRIEATILIGMLLMGALGMNFVSTAIVSAKSATQPLHHSEYSKFLPDAPPGWVAGEPRGEMFYGDVCDWSAIDVDYTKIGAKDKTANVLIEDCEYMLRQWDALWENATDGEKLYGYSQRVTVKGYPAYEEYFESIDEYSLYLNVDDRFSVSVLTNDGRDTLYDFANAIDYNSIAALGGGKDEEGGETPGFETVFAVVGLLAVMALLRRRG